MFTGPVGPVHVFFYRPEAVFGNFYWPGAIGLPLASSPVLYGFNIMIQLDVAKHILSSCLLIGVLSLHNIEICSI